MAAALNRVAKWAKDFVNDGSDPVSAVHSAVDVGSVELSERQFDNLVSELQMLDVYPQPRWPDDSPGIRESAGDHKAGGGWRRYTKRLPE